MKDQLAKFGVQCNELEDGIEVIGKGQDGGVSTPEVSIHCYDDHRVAMSFSVLAITSPGPVIVTERECVGKTWPGWWDILSQVFKVDMVGHESHADAHDEEIQEKTLESSVFIIGMRGAGKTTAGNWMAKILGWKFIDLDQELERRAGCTIPEMIRGDRGWDGFRADELALLRDVMEKNKTGHVFSCGGGLVETPEARELLNSYGANGGHVLLVHRDTDQVVEYLNRDKTRPAYTSEILQVYLRRKDFYNECSTHLYYSPHSESSGRQSHIPHDFQQFVHSIAGKTTHFKDVLNKDHSFFVSLTVPDVDQAVDLLPEVVVGSDAVELRVDLLQDRSVDSVIRQVSTLRASAKKPIVFTLRTESQGGKFPDSAYEEGLELYRLAVRMGMEYIDVEMTLPDEIIKTVTESRGYSRIIASHHDPKGTMSWKNASWIQYYNRALQYGDIIKLVGIARTPEDNFDLARFKARMQEAQKTPMISMNMGKAGKLSRVLNRFLTPVSHPALPFKAAPGQMSAAEIRQALALLGDLEPHNFYLFGKPISASRSPALHNTLFKQTGLPHQYRRLETDNIEDVRDVLKSPDFGGASVTIPLKLDIMGKLDELSDAARTIGAVNTVVPFGKPDDNGCRRLLGDNTDWRGMVHALRHAGIQGQDTDNKGAAMVVGSGGTTRAAIFALHSLGFGPIYIAARNQEKADAIAAEFPKEYQLEGLSKASDAEKVSENLKVVISTIPADRPIDPTLQELVGAVLSRPAPDGERLYQFELWTGITPLYKDARAAVLGE
ncbi:hypothetical protein NXS19_007640 [Fusarium pseudograminearum]|nr:hypothetical protein NXS19_007640 [Fusarium pseudograminearum]